MIDNMVKIGVLFPKNNVKLPKGWNKFTESRYNNEKNYAILTGKINNCIVIDLDNKDDFIGLKWFKQVFGEFNTFTTKSINGGYHIFFKYSDKIKNIANKKIHIDILSDERCCYQGDGYDIVNNTELRELQDNEINEILKLGKIDKDKNKDKQYYKKANETLNIPPNTDWIVTKTENGHKAVPKCEECLINPCKKHSQIEHSSLFINKDKSIIKSCYSCGSVVLNKYESKKIMHLFVIDTQENTVYQELVKNLIKNSNEHNYKRQKGTGIVYKQVKPYAYIKYLEPMDFLNELFYGDPDFKSNVNNMDNLVKYMKQYNDPEFQFLEYNKDYIGFNNGVLNIITLEFTHIPENDLVVKKYFDYEFEFSTHTPLMDKILDYQFDSDSRDFIYLYR